MSYSQINQEGIASYPAIQSGADERRMFLSKVYLLMFSGLLAFAAAIVVPILGYQLEIAPLAAIFELAIGLPPLVSFLVILGSSFLVHMVSMVKGVNLICFYAFAALWGFLTIPLTAYAVAVAGVAVVYQAAFLTCLVFGGLTAYVLISGHDFGFLGAALTMGLFLLIGVVVCALVASMLGVDVQVISLAISCFSVVLFSGYVLYDTSEIMHRYAADMVVPAALALMVDFIILFRNILYLLISLTSRD
jgi:FtsH-binding integral membrane protein